MGQEIMKLRIGCYLKHEPILIKKNVFIRSEYYNEEVFVSNFKKLDFLKEINKQNPYPLADEVLISLDSYSEIRDVLCYILVTQSDGTLELKGIQLIEDEDFISYESENEIVDFTSEIAFSLQELKKISSILKKCKTKYKWLLDLYDGFNPSIEFGVVFYCEEIA